MNWPGNPLIAEVDVRTWLVGLSRRAGRPVTLGEVPAEEWDALAGLGLDAVWLAGTWERSPCARLVAAEDQGFLTEARRALPDLAPGDLVGSPLAVRRYAADPWLGGPGGLAKARGELDRRGLRLVLDYVAGATALDHPRVFERPELYVAGAEEDLRRTPGLFFEAGGRVLAHARWEGGGVRPDAAQLDVFAPAARAEAAEEIAAAGAQCDGLFCHGAEQALSRAFAEAWGGRVGPTPEREFWAEVLEEARARRPGLLLGADTGEQGEWELLRLGFDLATDRRLGERLRAAGAPEVRDHLGADPEFQRRLMRSLGLGADPPAAALPRDRHRAAAAALLTLPGARLLGDGQPEGRRVPVVPGLGRAAGATDPDVSGFYVELLRATADPVFRQGRWLPCSARGWPGDPSWANLLAWGWELGEERRLAVVNFSPTSAHGRVRLPWPDLAGRGWVLTDALSGEAFVREGGELGAEGLYVGLPAWGVHLLRLA